MMTRVVILFVSFAFSLFGFSKTSFGQRPTISTWSGSDDITIRPLGMGSSSLNFNLHSSVITANSGPVQIRKEDDNTAVFEIEAPSEYEMVITMDYAPYLAKEGDSSIDQSIPMVFYMSYHNQNAANEIVAKKESIDLPAGITTITIPVNGKFAGIPLPSSSVFGGSLERHKSVVYLFVYGTLGPIRSVYAGEYNTQISINVNVAGETN
ncbi:MAG: hypothetical protein P8O16_09330 [Algoriphagus sp.]|uniref:hypothetical protein n=1 Tax=Algoriphagus sp. TaxID=1872435 RepID=UPI00262E698A|nr:hypothetical protein [Algoriphagus sp.]MDG1277470.1 hypothetical protein [Algoriphagus sp.]